MKKTISAILTCSLFSLVFFHQTAAAEPYSVIRLTNNNEPDGGQQIGDNGVVAYVGPSMSLSDGDIFLYESSTGKTQQLFADDEWGDSGPIMNASGDFVWLRNVPGSGEQLFLYDRSTSPPGIIQLTDVPKTIYSPHINNNRDIVYNTRPTDESDSEVFLYIRETGETLRLTDNEQYDGAARICDNGDVVYTHNDGDDEVYLYKRLSGQTIALSDNDYQDYYVGHNGVNARGDVAWRATLPGSDWEIFLYDNASNSVTQFVNDICDDNSPALNDHGDLVWDMSCPGIDREIIYYSGVSQTVVALTDNSWDDYLPVINNSGDVAWKGGSESSPYRYDVYLYDSSEGSTARLTDTEMEEFNIDLNNNSQIVWNRQVGIGSDSFEVFLASPTRLLPPEKENKAMAWMLLLLRE